MEEKEPQNPFNLLEDDQLQVLDYILEDLSDEDLISYFKQIVKPRMTNMSESQKKALQIAVDHLTDGLPLANGKLEFYSKKGCILEAHFMLSIYFDSL